MDERCDACQVLGGDEPPCQPASLLKAIEEETGHPCPRRESFNVDDGACLDLLSVSSSPVLNVFYSDMRDMLLEGMDPEDRGRVLRRVIAAFADQRIAGYLPKRLV